MKHFFYFLVLWMTIPAWGHAQFKVIGYLRSKRSLVNDVKTVDLKKITHLYIAFINPQPNGEFSSNTQLDTVVDIAHSHDVKVLMSCGGGDRHTFLDSLLGPAHRQRVVKNFLAFAAQHKLDGIDVDIENDDINENYEAFVTELGAGLHSKGKVMSAALSYATRKKITQTALNTYDFVTLMAYDKHAPWTPNDPGPHSPYEMAEEQISYWSRDRGLSKDKIVLGVPFYGYSFGPKGVFNVPFAEVLKIDPKANYIDEVSLPDGSTIYYNGFKTIRKKTALAKKKACGIMIWQLLYDAPGTLSLLNQINEEVVKKQ